MYVLKLKGFKFLLPNTSWIDYNIYTSFIKNEKDYNNE
jgi:hypothetical protein